MRHTSQWKPKNTAQFVSAHGKDEKGSAEYLAAYVRDYETTPPISLDAVMKSYWLIEQMGRDRLKLRTDPKN